MTSKPTYEELEERVRGLEKELGSNRGTTGTPRSKQHYLEVIINKTNLPIYLKDAEYKYIFINREYERLAYVTSDQIQGRDDFAIFPEPVAQLFREQDEEVVQRRALVEFEETIPLSDGVRTFLTAKFPLVDNDGRIYAIGGVCTDITAHREAKEALKKAHDELEQRVAERTAELDQRTERLMETNIALKILLDKREEDKKELEEKVIINIEKLIYPYLEKLKSRCNEASQEAILKIIRSNLEEITSSFEHKYNDYFSKLTPTQIQVADLIKQGQTTKEIAGILNLSPATIACHRQEIRKRLCLTNKGINLRVALSSHS